LKNSGWAGAARKGLRQAFHRGESQVILQIQWKQKAPICGAFAKALFRTRTGDPLLTMEVLYQLS
jgi:hypothetical protein